MPINRQIFVMLTEEQDHWEPQGASAISQVCQTIVNTFVVLEAIQSRKSKLLVYAIVNLVISKFNVNNAPNITLSTLAYDFFIIANLDLV